MPQNNAAPGQPPRSRQQRSGWRRRKRERPEEILDAAREELQRQGADEVRMRDIAARAGIAKGTIYLYFSGKQDLLDALSESQAG